MTELVRRLWIAKETGSPRYVAALVLAGSLLLGYGFAAHHGVATGLGTGALLAAAVIFVTYLRRKKS